MPLLALRKVRTVAATAATAIGATLDTRTTGFATGIIPADGFGRTAQATAFEVFAHTLVVVSALGVCRAASAIKTTVVQAALFAGAIGEAPAVCRAGFFGFVFAALCVSATGRAVCSAILRRFNETAGAVRACAAVYGTVVRRFRTLTASITALAVAICGTTLFVFRFGAESVSAQGAVAGAIQHSFRRTAGTVSANRRAIHGAVLGCFKEATALPIAAGERTLEEASSVFAWRADTITTLGTVVGTGLVALPVLADLVPTKWMAVFEADHGICPHSKFFSGLADAIAAKSAIFGTT